MKRFILALVLLSFSHLSYSNNIYEYVNKRCNYECTQVPYILLTIKYFALLNDIPVNWLTALVSVESRFNQYAKNGSTLGLTQVHVKIHSDKFEQNPFDIVENIRVGSKILRNCMDRKKNNPKESFECYNGGGDPDYYSKVSTEINKLKSVRFTHFFY